ncbi:MAG TPA: DUF6768 family protein [Sedimentisphaerales bacterium]|nr:DUF6768 family protein [Sedimentisphaerales bacterium]
MNDDIRQILDDAYDDSRQDSIRSMIGDFYSRKMLSVAALVWTWAVIFFAGAGYSAVKFFESEQTSEQIMYASIFVCLVQFIGLMKVLAWQMMARNSIKREIKRLEIRAVELAKLLDK